MSDSESGVDEVFLKYMWTQSEIAPEAATFINSFNNEETITKNSGTGNNWYLWIYGTDTAGNVLKTKTNAFYIDNTVPTCTISGLPTAWVTTATLTVSGTDANSGVASYSWDGTTYSSTQTKSITANGTYTAYVKDKVGNVQSCSATVSKIDTTTPTGSITLLELQD